MQSILDLFGRIFISSIFLFSAINKIIQYESTIDWMETFGLPGLFLIPAIIIEIIFPIFIILGYRVKLAAGFLTLFCLVTAFIFHFDFSNQIQIIAFLKNLGLAGGLMFLIANGPKNFVLIKKKKYVKL
jgi:putative oxidoreductase